MVSVWKKWDLVHIHHISYGVIYFLQHSHWHVTNSCKKYKIAFLRFTFILISQCTYWFLIFYGFCLISREDYSISLNNVVGYYPSGISIFRYMFGHSCSLDHTYMQDGHISWKIKTCKSLNLQSIVKME